MARRLSKGIGEPLAGFAIALMAQTLGLGTCFVSLAHKGLSASKRCRQLVGSGSKEVLSRGADPRSLSDEVQVEFAGQLAESLGALVKP